MGEIDNANAFFVEHFSEAIEKGYIHAYYQPIYRSMTGRLACAESLARWIDPEKGTIPPAEFIPALEQGGLIFDLDMEILRQTCAFYADLRDRGTLVHSFSVNLSRQDFLNENLADRVIETLARYDVPHDAIKLEVTESLMLEDAEAFSGVLKTLNEAGFSMWMDDFGSGYSSLNVLKNYHFDLMKFDMLFLRDFSLKGRQLLSSLINMAKSLGIHTLMEGVEEAEHQQYLHSAGCEFQQGYYFAKPVSKDEFKALLDKEISSLESSADKKYWDRIGKLNLLSARPLQEFAGMEQNPDEADIKNVGSGIPIALLECTSDKVAYVYGSDSYLLRLNDLGYESAEAWENDFNNHQSDQYLMLKKLVSDAIGKGTIQRVEYINNDVYYRLSARCLAKEKDRAMLAFYLTTFDSEKEVETAKEMLSYGNALFSTYEVVVLFYPESGIANRVYSASNLPTYDREDTLKESLQRFCKAEVLEQDQERYMKFLDFDTVFRRVDESEKGYVQGIFRMSWGGTMNNWHSVRLTRVPTTAEKAYLLTIQKMADQALAAIDLIIKEHPELVK